MERQHQYTHVYYSLAVKTTQISQKDVALQSKYVYYLLKLVFILRSETGHELEWFPTKKTDLLLKAYLVYQLKACFLARNYLNTCPDLDLRKNRPLIRGEILSCVFPSRKRIKNLAYMEPIWTFLFQKQKVVTHNVVI